MWIRRFAVAGLIFCAGGASAAADPLPRGFVYLRDTVPDIRQDMRYAGRDNFMRKRLPGYGAPECVLTQDAARALGRTQSAAVSAGYSLVVFDCYRPQRAVNAMVAWVNAGKGTDPAYYPNVSRAQLIRQGYIGAKSSHARGSTVDVALELLSGPAHEPDARAACARKDRETADFGTPFDCFDPASRTESTAVAVSAQILRRKLVALMQRGGFRNYPGEWWHFTLQGEPFPGTAFDFAIERR
ncbi:M15 family metallopeptidase [Roseibium marinum]|uniref:D-alanyl-D-alanine dipeptidase n=1 Tax=Roseibium marinum TaxID=281252 RepID=A0A2S3US59_9HYPH|nr:M15 family metallopeptidase [Roseibium marinum]POF30567.1 D-alanyl-D-alanine dipeptidase [Roseibium marinum]